MTDPTKGEHKKIAWGAGVRTLKQRPVTFRCAWCGQLVTELRYPGPTPAYGQACRAEALRYAEAAKKARQRNAAPPAAERTTTCWDSPTNLLMYGYVDPKAEALIRSSVAVKETDGRIEAALEARRVDRTNEDVRRFLEECGL
jgi:hypothetical protein